MSFLILMTVLGLGYYFLWRRGRGPEQPTVAEDLKGLFRRGKDPKPDPEENRRPVAPSQEEIAIRQRDGHSLESDPDLDDSKRVEEIMELTDIWNLNQDTEKDGKNR